MTGYEFHAVSHAVYDFCVVDMSNFYLDIIKDRLYCGSEAQRRCAQTALYCILDGMTRLIAPILAFTCDEIWHAMKHAGDARRRERPPQRHARVRERRLTPSWTRPPRPAGRSWSACATR